MTSTTHYFSGIHGLLLLLAILPISAPVVASQAISEAHEHEHEGGHEHGHPAETDSDHDDDTGIVELTPRQRQLAGIRTETLRLRKLNYALYAPGEIKSSDYASYLVSPRVPSVVLRRHVVLGDAVQMGQPLVTLFADEVAAAQAAYRVALSEQRRVQQLGRAAVGEKRVVDADNTLAAAHARLIAYGLNDDAVAALAVDSPSRLGEYTLGSQRDGVVLSDDFRQGQHVDSGAPLIELVDENELWVEAYLAPDSPAQLPAGSSAQVQAGNITLTGTVIQQAHTIDPVTRTRRVRLNIDNRAHLLHPGMFADVHFLFTTDEPVLAVPESALMYSADGAWQLYVEQMPGHYRAQTVTLGRSLGDLREVQGVDAGTTVVTEGAFFIASQRARGGFDPHNH
ncbi:MAG: efflux RND transporter periplasmic adaptor subunit [Alcanivorax sp.]|nr:efflux RND transporter periplasmic adaptor subunit [Alcanivorax sp.]